MGNNNTCVGNAANCAVGVSSLVAVGASSIAGATGSTAVGFEAIVQSSATGSIALGNGANASIASAFYTILNLASVSGGNSLEYLAGTGQIGPSTSSKRFKENIDPIEIDTSFIYALQPKSYDRIDMQLRNREFGFIAEEVDSLCPQLVPYDGEGRPNGVKYDRLTVPIIAEMKKLRDDLADTKASLKTAIDVIDALKAKIAL